MAGFRDRADAGRQLAGRLKAYAHQPDLLVLALPRGGVPVAFEVAHALGAPLDIFLVRKLGVPGHEELAMGAIASGGVRVLNPENVHGLRIPREVIDAVAAREERELNRRARAYRGARPAPSIRGRTIILVDDGLATGATMRASTPARSRPPPTGVVQPSVSGCGRRYQIATRRSSMRRVCRACCCAYATATAPWLRYASPGWSGRSG